MNTSSILTCAMVLLASAGVAEAQGLAVTGTVSFYIDQDSLGQNLSPDKCEYVPLDDVQVQLIRNRIIKRTVLSVFNNVAGDFNLPVEAGGPANVLFMHKGGRYVPTLKLLAFDPQRGNHRVHVTVLTPAQFLRMYTDDEYKLHLQRIWKFIRSIDGQGAGELREQFQEHLRIADVRIDTH